MNLHASSSRQRQTIVPRPSFTLCKEKIYEALRRCISGQPFALTPNLNEPRTVVAGEIMGNRVGSLYPFRPFLRLSDIGSAFFLSQLVFHPFLDDTPKCL